MNPFFRVYGLALVYSLLLHAVLISLFFISFNSEIKRSQIESVPEIMKATVLDETKIQAELKKLRDQEEAERLKENQRQQQLEQARKQEEKRLASVRKKRVAEEKQAQKIAKKRKLEEAANAKRIALVKQQEKKDRARLAKLEKQKKLAERKRQKEEKRLAALEIERKRYEKEKQQREKEKKRIAAEKQAKEKRLAAERKRKAADQKRSAEAARRAKKAIIGAQILIQQKVNRSWLRPPSANRGLSCKIQVKLIPGGEVVDAKVIKSSGNIAFDRSAEIAVRKASPLPLPSDPALFSKFRNFDFKFTPDT